MITDEFIMVNDIKIKKITLLFIDHKSEPTLCDGCNETKQCAHLDTITKEVFVICKDCLMEIIKGFDE